MNVIGLKCRYAGDDGSLRARRLVVAGVIRGALGAVPGRLHVETDDSEFEDWPVTADDVVRVRVEGGARRRTCARWISTCFGTCRRHG